MDNFIRDKDRDTILFINEIANNQMDDVLRAVEIVSKRLRRELNVLIVTDKNDKIARNMKLPKHFKQIKVNTNSIIQLEKALLPYMDKLLVAVCRGERNIPYFERIIPYIPYLRTPTEESLDWTANKISMRRRLSSFSSKLSPSYTIVNDASEESVAKIRKNVGYPCVVKPASLAASALVTVCYHKEDLEAALKEIFKRLKKVHKDRGYESDMKVLAEEFMEGTMYSTDIYVNSRGTSYSTPLVHIITGFMEGKGDFFGYKQMTPSTLKLETRRKAVAVAKEAVKALGMRSITAHVELMKTPRGWRVIEVGPRVGGFRDFLYETSYGFNHAANDILIRLPLKPNVKFRPKAYSCVMKIYAESEGIIERISGVQEVQKLESFKRIDIRYQKGDKATFARHGGVSVADVFLSHKERSDLLADMRRVEQKLSIKIDSKKPFTAEVPSSVSEQMSEDIVISK